MKFDQTAVQADAGQRLDAWLSQQTTTSRTAIQSALAAGSFTVNGQAAKPSYRLVAGDQILGELIQEETQRFDPPELEIIYQDSDLAVVNKPAGLLVHAYSGSRPQPTVADFAATISTDTQPQRPGIVHRLDRQTSGLLILAKTAASKQELQKLFAERQIKKTYLILVSGRLEPADATIKLPIARRSGQVAKRHIDRSGRPAITKYHVLEYLPGYTLVEAYPETGRTHQLRVHFAHLGHPVAGDQLYGGSNPAGLKRLFLHASGLRFQHQGKALELASDLPPELKDVIKGLEAL